MKKTIYWGSGFNIFSLNKGDLHTPKQGVLNGIARGAVIDIAKELDILVNLGLMSFENLSSSEEVFVISTAGGIMLITKINGEKVGGKFW